MTRVGFIVVPDVGRIGVNNLSLGQLREILYDRLGAVYSGVTRKDNPCIRSKMVGGWWEPRDPLALAAAMRGTLLRLDPGDLPQMGNRGRRRAEERFSSRRFAEEVERVFQQVAGTNRSK